MAKMTEDQEDKKVGSPSENIDSESVQGGGAADENQSDADLNFNEDSQAPQQDQAAAPAQVPQAAPQSAQASSQQPAQPQIAQAQQAAPGDQMGNAQPMQTSASGQPVDPQTEAMEQNVHAAQFADDLHYGRVQPKTYQDLFDDKSTLGKIGTIFGLMVSGAGSGLAHQPNLLMDMMNKQIDRDLEAQKTNQSNKLNWYNAAVNHQRNQALNAQTAAMTQMTGIEALGKAAEADRQMGLNKKFGLDELTATTQAKNNMQLAGIQTIQNSINSMPPGPLRDQQQNMLDNVLRPAAFQAISQRNSDTAHKKQLFSVLTSPPPKQDPNAPVDLRAPVVDQRKLNAGIEAGRWDTRIPGAIPPEQVSRINDAINRVEYNRNGLADAVDSFNNLSKLSMAGQAPGAKVATGLAGLIPFVGSGAAHAADEAKEAFERQRNIQAEALKQRVGRNMSEEEKNKLINSMLPSWTDSPRSRAEAFRKMVQHFQSMESQDYSDLKQYNLIKPFPNVQFTPAKESPVEKNAPPKKQELDLSKFAQ